MNYVAQKLLKKFKYIIYLVVSMNIILMTLP